MNEVDIRAQARDEHDAVLEVVRSAFGDEGDHVARLWNEVSGENLVQASFVAADGGDLVGHVGVSHAWLDTRQRLLDVALLSPLSIVPERQQEGIGTRLIEAALAAADAQGYPAIFLEGAPSYYAKRGFSSARDLGFQPPTDRIPGAAFQVATLRGYEDWMTGRVVYREVWWRHDSTGLRDPILAEIERGDLK